MKLNSGRIYVQIAYGNMSLAPVLVYAILATVLQLCYVPGALGAIYPTKPISNTTYSAGLPAQIKWIEDGKRPFLNATGDVKIELWAGNNTFIATLGKGIDPMASSTTIFIPSSVPTNYRVYVLHFITTEPPQTIYTAQFYIMPNPLAAPSSSSVPRSSNTSATTVTSTIYSRVVSTEIVTPSTTTAPQKVSAGLEKSWGMRGRIEPLGLLTSDPEKMRFRLVFVVWPVLVGFSMTL